MPLKVEHRTGHRKRWTRGIERTLMVSLYQLYFIALALVFQTVSLSNTRLPFSLMFCSALGCVDYGVRSMQQSAYDWMMRWVVE